MIIMTAEKNQIQDYLEKNKLEYIELKIKPKWTK